MKKYNPDCIKKIPKNKIKQNIQGERFRKYIVLPNLLQLPTNTFFKVNKTARLNNKLIYCERIEQNDREIKYIFGYR